MHLWSIHTELPIESTECSISQVPHRDVGIYWFIAISSSEIIVYNASVLLRSKSDQSWWISWVDTGLQARLFCYFWQQSCCHHRKAVSLHMCQMSDTKRAPASFRESLYIWTQHILNADFPPTGDEVLCPVIYLKPQLSKFSLHRQNGDKYILYMDINCGYLQHTGSYIAQYLTGPLSWQMSREDKR